MKRTFPVLCQWVLLPPCCLGGDLTVLFRLIDCWISKMTSSYESAAILSTFNVPSDQLVSKFQSYRLFFNSWNFEVSEDTACFSIFSDFRFGTPRRTIKLTIIENGLRNYVWYPLVASAILASISTLEANETLDLMEKASFILGSCTRDLERSEVISLAVRMIHGIKNELLKNLIQPQPL